MSRIDKLKEFPLDSLQQNDFKRKLELRRRARNSETWSDAFLSSYERISNYIPKSCERRLTVPPQIPSGPPATSAKTKAIALDGVSRNK
jgi:hypothetical protein